MSLAVVLGGGAMAGTAWQGGLIAGLAESGFDVAAADLLLCTSAAAPLRARLALGASPAEASSSWLAMDDQPPAGHDAKASYAALLDALVACDGRPLALGRLALDAETMPERAHVDGMGRAINETVGWPRAFACTALDCLTGELAVWDASSRVSLARATASSCALPVVRPPITIRDRRYMDGGARSGTNADLAWQHHHVVIITAIRDQAPARRERRRQDVEIDILQAVGCTVELITPDQAGLDAIGPNTMAAGTCRAAYAQGLRQGRAAGLRRAA